MNRQELSQKFANYRKENGPMMKEICSKLSCLPQDVYRIEKGKFSYNLQKCLDYMEVVGLQMTIDTTSESYIITEYKTLIDVLIKLRKERNYSQRSLAAAAECTHVTIAYYESQGKMISIDMLLKVINALGAQIDVSPKF